MNSNIDNYNEIVNNNFGDIKQVDLFLERDNPIEYHELNKFGFTNNIFIRLDYSPADTLLSRYILQY